MGEVQLPPPSLYQPSQRAELLLFLRRVYGKSSLFAQERYVRWLYEEPEGGALYLQWSGPQVVGQLGSQRCVLSVLGQEVVAHWAVNFVVAPELQKSGIGAALAKARRADTAVSLSIDLTDAAARVAQRFQNESIGAAPIYARASSVGAISRRFGSWSSPFALLAMPALALLDLAATRAVRARKLELLPVTAFDERADRLWEANKRRYPVVSQRNAAALNWRFARYPVPDRYRLFYALRAGATIGYVVLRTELREGVLDGVVVDFFCAPEDAYGLLACAMAELRKQGAGAIFCLCGMPGAAAPTRALGFVRRPGAWPIFVRTTGIAPELDKPLHDLGAWFLTSAESDIDRPR
jgi:hypothetical protein